MTGFVCRRVRVYSQGNLLRSTRELWCLFCFAWSRAHGFLEVAVDRIIELALPLAQRQGVKVEGFVLLPRAEIFPVPLLQRAV